MPDEPIVPPTEPEKTAPPAEKKRPVRARTKAGAKAPPPEAESEKAEETETPVPKRATLGASERALLTARKRLDRRRPVFGRQAANRYYRIGRDGAWRRPRGLQSKQRRHYGYRPKVVRIGYRSPARVRGLVPSGFRPIVVRTLGDLDGIDGQTEAAVIARTVGTRRRLVLEEEARKLGIRVLNPIVKGEGEA